MTDLSHDDLVIRAYPERGRGGQHVGISTGVSILHKPTHCIAIVQTYRSQHKNREIALDMIEVMLDYDGEDFTHDLPHFAKITKREDWWEVDAEHLVAIAPDKLVAVAMAFAGLVASS